MRFQRGGRDARWWITFGGIAFGALFLAIGLVLGGMSVSLAVSGKHAEGTVVHMEWSSGTSSGSSRKSRGSGPSAHPVVLFTPAGGESVTFRSSAGSNPPAYDVGDRVDVLYRADDPEDAQIDGFLSMWLLPLIFSGIGLVILAIATAFAVARRRRSRVAGAPPVALTKA
ncbi:DUF3592 domain-containing protein [Streptomyces sp. cg35]|uniref:DUF3592 domain-containing protein n=1 Tax=Streptomyces sp. cg35 TaxID=3421650 RepID=UPI003D162609